MSLREPRPTHTAELSPGVAFRAIKAVKQDRLSKLQRFMEGALGALEVTLGGALIAGSVLVGGGDLGFLGVPGALLGAEGATRLHSAVTGKPRDY